MAEAGGQKPVRSGKPGKPGKPGKSGKPGRQGKSNWVPKAEAKDLEDTGSQTVPALSEEKGTQTYPDLTAQQERKPPQAEKSLQAKPVYFSRLVQTEGRVLPYPFPSTWRPADWLLDPPGNARHRRQSR